MTTTITVTGPARATLGDLLATAHDTARTQLADPVRVAHTRPETTNGVRSMTVTFTERPHLDDDEQWSTRDVARLINNKQVTIRSYNSRRLMPPPDGHLGRTPWWRESTIRAWTGIPRGHE